MKTYEKVQIIRTKVISPDQLRAIVLIVLGSFAVGLIPIFLASQTPNANMIVPSEAALWKPLFSEE